MLPLIRDLFLHEAWADAEHWRAILASDAMREDPDIRERLHHIHLVQHAFWNVLTHQPFDGIAESKKKPSLDELLPWARVYHDGFPTYLAGLTDADLEQRTPLAWWPNFEPPLRDILTQIAMHSQSHRGQNATRMRQLGGKAPMTDFIAWAQAGRPAPQWP